MMMNFADSSIANNNNSQTIDLGFEVLAAVVMKVVIFWDIAPCSPYVVWRFGGCIISILRVENYPIKKPTFSMSIPAWLTWRYIPGDGNIQKVELINVRI
jgi:hypothetical protein